MGILARFSFALRCRSADCTQSCSQPFAFQHMLRLPPQIIDWKLVRTYREFFPILHTEADGIPYPPPVPSFGFASVLANWRRAPVNGLLFCSLSQTNTCQIDDCRLCDHTKKMVVQLYKSE